MALQSQHLQFPTVVEIPHHFVDLILEVFHVQLDTVNHVLVDISPGEEVSLAIVEKPPVAVDSLPEVVLQVIVQQVAHLFVGGIVLGNSEALVGEDLSDPGRVPAEEPKQVVLAIHVEEGEVFPHAIVDRFFGEIVVRDLIDALSVFVLLSNEVVLDLEDELQFGHIGAEDLNWIKSVFVHWRTLHCVLQISIVPIRVLTPRAIQEEKQSDNFHQLFRYFSNLSSSANH